MRTCASLILSSTSTRYVISLYSPLYLDHSTLIQAHHILSEIIQGGLVIETNLEEIDAAGEPSPPFGNRTMGSFHIRVLVLSLNCALLTSIFAVRQASQARKQSFSSANPLALGGVGGGVGPRSAGLQTPLNWLSGKLGVAR